MEFALQRFDYRWLTTHCRDGDNAHVLAYLKPYCTDAVFELVKQVKPTTWIEIELVDEEGGPIPYERYEITAPDGETIIKGALDRHGRAHRVVPGAPGEICKITFPELDLEAWERL